jgi:release factor H-coupled RctB family protein
MRNSLRGHLRWPDEARCTGATRALSELKTRYTRASLQRTATGGRVVCDETQLLYEEHPDAYKSVEAVLSAVVAARMATPVASLEPTVTVKR